MSNARNTPKPSDSKPLENLEKVAGDSYDLTTLNEKFQLLENNNSAKDEAIARLSTQLAELQNKMVQQMSNGITLQQEAIGETEVHELVSVAELTKVLDGVSKAQPVEISLGQEIYRRMQMPGWDIKNKPNNAALVWCTERQLDKGMHEGLLTEYSYRYVKGNELATYPTSDHMYCLAPFEVDEYNNVNMSGSYLMIGSKEVAQKINRMLADLNAPKKMKSGSTLDVGNTPGGMPVTMSVETSEKVVRITPVDGAARYNPNA